MLIFFILVIYWFRYSFQVVNSKDDANVYKKIITFIKILHKKNIPLANLSEKQHFATSNEDLTSKCSKNSH